MVLLNKKADRTLLHSPLKLKLTHCCVRWSFTQDLPQCPIYVFNTWNIFALTRLKMIM